MTGRPSFALGGQEPTPLLPSLAASCKETDGTGLTLHVSAVNRSRRMVEYIYDRREVLKRVIPFQIILIILLWWSYRLASGDMISKSSVATMLILVGGFSLYIFFMAMFARMLWGGPLISLDRRGELTYQELFKVRREQIPNDSRVAFDNEAVRIETSAAKLVGKKARNGAVELTIPKGLMAVRPGNTLIGGSKNAR